MRQRGKVARSAQRPLLRDNRHDAFIEHLGHHGHQHRTHAGDADAQGVGAQQQHAADNLLGVGLAGGGAVAEDQVGGEGVGHLLRHGNLGKVAESGGDAVGYPLFSGDLFGKVAGFLHVGNRLGRDADLGAKAGDSHKGLDGQAVSVDDDLMDGGWVHNHRFQSSLYGKKIVRAGNAQDVSSLISR